MLRAASDHADLTFHGLAFVPPRVDAPDLVRAASLFRPAWVALANERFPAGAFAPIAHDAPAVGAMAGTAEAALGLQRLAFLHDSIPRFLSTARRSLSELQPADVDRPDELAALKLVPEAPVEVFRSGLLLSARAFTAVHAVALRPFESRVIEALAPRWERLVQQSPGLADLTVHVSATLGPRGRLLGDTVHVGTSTLPFAADAPDTDTPLALAAHEASVRASAEALRAHGSSAPWSLIERAALAGAALAYRGTEVEAAYAVWRLGLSEVGLSPHDAAIEHLAGEIRDRLRSR
ncbi:MAG: hypothetical protein R3B70_14735 [Polyangiaceae bacterium]